MQRTNTNIENNQSDSRVPPPPSFSTHYIQGLQSRIYEHEHIPQPYPKNRIYPEYREPTPVASWNRTNTYTIEPAWTRSVGCGSRKTEPTVKRCGISRKTAGGERLVSPWLIVDVSRAVVRRSREGRSWGRGGEIQPRQRRTLCGSSRREVWAGERDGGGTKGGMPRTERR